MFNPFEYQVHASIKSRNDANAEISVQRGAERAELSIPAILLPESLVPGVDFVIRFLPKESAEQGEYETLRKLLQDLIG